MGYYTSVSLCVDVNSENAEEIYKALDSERFFESLDYDARWVNAHIYTKWYDGDTDKIVELSVKFPAAFFTLDGDGEDSDDFWRAYIQNGAIQTVYAELTYEDYNPAKMEQLVQPLVPNFKAPVADLI